MCFRCGLSDVPDCYWEHGCALENMPTAATTSSDLGTPAQPALLFPEMLSLADALPGCLCTSKELCSWCSNSLIASSPPIPLENLWDHLKSVKYGSKSRAAKRSFGSDAEQDSSTKVSFDQMFKRRAFKDSIEYDLAMKKKRVKLALTSSDGFDVFNGSNTFGGSFDGNDENIASIPQALSENELSTGTSNSAEF